MAPISEYMMEQLQFAAARMKGLLDPVRDEDTRVVQKGLMLYRQNLVYGMRFEGDTIVANVQDVVPVQVRVDLEFLETSECSCPGEGFCRHQLAVFFQGLAQAGSVAKWVEEWRQPLKEKKTATILGMQTARDLLKASKRLGPDADYDAWTATFTQSFTGIMVGQGVPQPYVVGDLFRVYWRRVKADAPVEAEWRTLYELVACVHSFSLLSELSEELGHSDYYVEHYYRVLFHTIMEDAHGAMRKLSLSSLPFAFDDFLKKLKDDAGKLLYVRGLVELEGVEFYQALWAMVLRKAEWREAERARLAALIETVRAEMERAEAGAGLAGLFGDDDSAGEGAGFESIGRVGAEGKGDGAGDLGEGSRDLGDRPANLSDGTGDPGDGYGEDLGDEGSRDLSVGAADLGEGSRGKRVAPPLMLAVGLAHQHFLAKDDDAAIELLGHVGGTVVPFMFYWLEGLSEAREWKRMAPYIDFFIGQLPSYLGQLNEYSECSQFTMMAMELLAPYCAESGRLDMFERTLIQTLPYSYHEYDAFLFEQRSYEKWIELQAFIGVEAPYVANEDLKMVQKASPAALLPFYHQAVQEYIDAKNRGSYREAVKLMKKLRTIYKKLNRMGDWERFFELILTQTKRLRAFHEELKRGKLLHAEE